MASNGEGIRAIRQGGVEIGGVKVDDPKRAVVEGDFADGKLLLKKGKKGYCLAVLV